MSVKHEEIFFEEDRGFFLKKKLNKLALGLILLIFPPITLYYMFFYLLRWSSFFEKETGLILISLIISPLFGFYFTAKGLFMPRLRIYADRIPNPVFLGKRYIPLDDIALVAVKYSDTEPIMVELHLKKESKSTLDKQIVLGEFLDSDTTKMSSAFRKRGVKAKLR